MGTRGKNLISDSNLYSYESLDWKNMFWTLFEFLALKKVLLRLSNNNYWLSSPNPYKMFEVVFQWKFPTHFILNRQFLSFKFPFQPSFTTFAISNKNCPWLNHKNDRNLLKWNKIRHKNFFGTFENSQFVIQEIFFFFFSSLYKWISWNCQFESDYSLSR